jgi:hypothetical protein
MMSIINIQKAAQSVANSSHPLIYNDAQNHTKQGVYGGLLFLIATNILGRTTVFGEESGYIFIILCVVLCNAFNEKIDDKSFLRRFIALSIPVGLQIFLVEFSLILILLALKVKNPLSPLYMDGFFGFFFVIKMLFAYDYLRQLYTKNDTV